MKPASKPKMHRVSEPSDDTKPTVSWRYALWYLFWLLPTFLLVAVWILVIDIGYAGNSNPQWFIMIALAEFLPVFAIVAGVTACIGLLLFARFFARKTHVLWSLPIFVLGLAALVWLFFSFL